MGLRGKMGHTHVKNEEKGHKKHIIEEIEPYKNFAPQLLKSAWGLRDL